MKMNDAGGYRRFQGEAAIHAVADYWLSKLYSAPYIKKKKIDKNKLYEM